MSCVNNPAVVSSTAAEGCEILRSDFVQRLGTVCSRARLMHIHVPSFSSAVVHKHRATLKTITCISSPDVLISSEGDTMLDSHTNPLDHDGVDSVSIISTLPSEAPVFYKRILPDTCVDYTSARGKEIFRNAMQEGFLETFFAVSAQFRTQEEPAFCGLSTLVVVLNALSVDPGRVWKGAWRWYSETMLECCVSIAYVKEFGITFDQFECLAMCNSLTVQSTRADEGSVEDFRSTVQRVLSHDNGTLLVASYDRGVLGQTGTGHFSPLAGYSQRDDMVLVMDVARFKYNPHWVPVTLLWEAMHPVDTTTQRSRGYMVMQRHRESTLSVVRVGDIDDCCVPGLLQKAADLVGSTGEREVTLLTDASAGDVVEQLVMYMVQCDCAGLEAVPVPPPFNPPANVASTCCTGTCSGKSMVRLTPQENGSAGGKMRTRESGVGDNQVRVHTEAQVRELLETLPHVMAAVRRVLSAQAHRAATGETTNAEPETTESSTGTIAKARGYDCGSASGTRCGSGCGASDGAKTVAKVSPKGAGHEGLYGSPDVQLALLALAVLPYTENTITLLGAETAQRLKPVIQEICAIRQQMENVMAYRKATHNPKTQCSKNTTPLPHHT